MTGSKGLKRYDRADSDAALWPCIERQLAVRTSATSCRARRALTFLHAVEEESLAHERMNAILLAGTEAGNVAVAVIRNRCRSVFVNPW